MNGENISELFKSSIEEAIKDRGRINIIIAGRTGVGKSTLINAIFQKDIAKTGQGRPVSMNTREIKHSDIPLTIFDTRGLEMDAFKETLSELESLVIDRSNEVDSNRHIHVAWLCIQEDGRRVEDAEIELHNMLTEHMPLLTIITKARSDMNFQSEVTRLLPKAKNTIRVRSIPEKFDDGQSLATMGLENLVYATSELIPEGQHKAFSASQKACIKYKSQQAEKIVVKATTAAGLAGASPIPFSDAAILAPIQVGMLVGISSVFGLGISGSFLSTLVSSALGVSGTSLVGRAIASNLLKMIPGCGSLGGGAISAATAITLTAALGKAYTAVIENIFEANPDSVPNAEEIAEKLKEQMRLKS